MLRKYVERVQPQPPSEEPESNESLESIFAEESPEEEEEGEEELLRVRVHPFLLTTDKVPYQDQDWESDSEDSTQEQIGAPDEQEDGGMLNKEGENPGAKEPIRESGEPNRQ
jgi:hypothetical protein